MARAGKTFRDVEAIAAALPDVESTTTWGQPALKVRGKLFACMSAHKSAEPNTLVLKMGSDERDALIADAPDVYYLTDHYRSYPYVLVRLSRVGADALRELVTGAYRFTCAELSKKKSKSG
jgi:hypothetical protein